MPAAKSDMAGLEALYARGLNDGQIASELGWGLCTVGKHRRRLGLTTRHGPREIQRRMAVTNAATRSARCHAANRGLAETYGLPGDLKPVEVAVLLALLDGPATADTLADRCGRSPGLGSHRFQAPYVSGGNYLTHLGRRGLVAYVPGRRGPGSGSGRGLGRFVLTAAALDHFASAPKEQLR